MRRSASGKEQRGAATIAITVLLFFALLLAVTALDRSLVFEHRASVNQYRATQAFEAAEAGLEWALARIDDERPIGADCAPTNAVGAGSFREKRLAWDATTGAIAPVTWFDAGVVAPVHSTCVRGADGWACSCPAASLPVLVVPDDGPSPAFTVFFQPMARAGVVRAVAIGCTSLGGACAEGVDTTDATMRVEAVFALLPALRSSPTAAITVRGAVDADAAAFHAANADPGSAVALHAGGAVRASSARIEGPAGTPADEAVVAHDASLAGNPAARYFSGLFGLDPSTWSRLPGVRHVACPRVGDCGEAVRSALAIDRGQPLIHIDGDLDLQGPLPLGSTDAPVTIVVAGTARMRGAVEITGVLHGAQVEWWAAPGDSGFIRGALSSEGDYRGDGTPTLVYDAAVLARLRGWSGSFVRLPGSWKDF